MSLFYTAQFEHMFPVPLLAFERLSALQGIPPEDAVRQVLAECCGLPDPTESQVIYFLSRIKTESEDAERVVSESVPEISLEGSPVQQEKTLGSSFQQFLSSLDSARILLWACGYDYEKAKYIYTKVDRVIANHIINDFIRCQYELNLYQFESALYGFGGSYKSDETSGSGEDTLDLTDMDAASMLAALTL